MAMAIVLSTELVDWRVGEQEVEDEPCRHWPVKLSTTRPTVLAGQINAAISRPDGSVLELVLELDTDSLAVRVYGLDPHGGWVGCGEPLVNTRVHIDSTVEQLE